MEFYAIGDKHSEECFYDFDAGNVSHNLTSKCLLPTNEMAEEIIEDQFGDEAVVVKITIHSYTEDKIMGYSRSRVPEWDNEY